MENGLYGVSGLPVLPPVVQEHAAEAGCVTAHHHNMAGKTAPVIALSLTAARLRNVLVRHLERPLLHFIQTLSTLH